MRFNNEIFAIVRGALGYSQEDMAEKLDWTQGKVSKVEHNLIQVPREDAEHVANRLHIPVELFYEGASVVGMGSCCQYDRKRKTAPVKRIRQLHDDINLRRIQLGSLIRGIDSMLYELNFPDLDVDLFDGPENAAKVLRRAWQIPRGRIVNLIDIVERAGAIVVYCGLGESTIDAVSQRSQGLPHLIFIDDSKPFDRCRFSLAHEIGHLVMHKHPSPDAESEADRFAAEFLMPAEDIADDLKNLSIAKAATLKLKWRVSMQSLIYRAKQLNIISDSRYKSLMVQISKFGYRKNEPHRLTPEHPSLLNWILVHYMGRGFSVAELSRAALCSEEYFRREYLREGPTLRVV